MTADEILSKLQLYQKCWDKWGADMQLDILIEEMAELTQAILKARRLGAIPFTPAVCAEFADVTICMEQVEAQLRKIGLYDIVVDEKISKLRRLQCRVGDEP